MFDQTLTVLIAKISFITGMVIVPSGTMLEAQQTPEFNPRVVIRKPFEAIIQPRFVSAEEASKSLHENELVLGVEIDGESRAYPINMLTGPQREIINDKLGGKAIAATW
jgi:retron-type reverse transcriptase